MDELEEEGGDFLKWPSPTQYPQEDDDDTDAKHVHTTRYEADEECQVSNIASSSSMATTVAAKARGGHGKSSPTGAGSAAASAPLMRSIQDDTGEDSQDQEDGYHGKIGIHDKGGATRKRGGEPLEEETFRVRWHNLSHDVKEDTVYPVTDRCSIAACEAPGDTGGILACGGYDDNVLHSFHDMFKLSMSALEWGLLRPSAEERCFTHASMFSVHIAPDCPKRVFVIGALDTESPLESQRTTDDNTGLRRKESLPSQVGPTTGDNGKYLEVWEWLTDQNTWIRQPGEPKEGGPHTPTTSTNHKKAAHGRQGEKSTDSQSPQGSNTPLSLGYPADKPIPSAPWTREGFASVAIQKRIFVYGGLDRSGIIDQELRSSNEFRTLFNRKMKNPKANATTHFAAFAVNHFARSQLVEQVRGYENLMSPTQQQSSNSDDWFCGDLWMYNVVKTRWKRIKCDRGKIPTPRAFANITVVTNPMRLLLYGGLGPYKREPLEDINVFELNQSVNGSWSQPTLRGDLLGPRLNGCMQTIDENAVIIYGGRTGSAQDTLSFDVNVLDPKTYTVRTAPISTGEPVARESPGFVVLKNPEKYDPVRRTLKASEHITAGSTPPQRGSPTTEDDIGTLGSRRLQSSSCILVFGGRTAGAGTSQAGSTSGTHLLIVDRFEKSQRRKQRLLDSNDASLPAHKGSDARKTQRQLAGSAASCNPIEAYLRECIEKTETKLSELIELQNRGREVSEGDLPGIIEDKMLTLEERVNKRFDNLHRLLNDKGTNSGEERILRSEVTRLQEINSRYEGQIQSLQSQVKNEQVRRESLQRENSSLYAKLRSYEDSYNRDYELNALAQVEARHASKQLQSKEQELSDARKEIQQLQQKTWNLSESLRTESSKRHAASSELQRLKRTLQNIVSGDLGEETIDYGHTRSESCTTSTTHTSTTTAPSGTNNA
eukprot:gb/GECG01010807.1/.p1 GENE.gb/GECG01010807.1/~~gb/GECG01010807.1/.p1  ORF type:complete len:942 (+),score=140.04 gb/GECG01010807.1/:1-2826(+)